MEWYILQVPEIQGDFSSSPVLFSLSTKHLKLLSHPFLLSLRDPMGPAEPEGNFPWTVTWLCGH